MKRGYNMRSVQELFRVPVYLWTLDELSNYYSNDGGSTCVVIDVISINLTSPWESKINADMIPKEYDK